MTRSSKHSSPARTSPATTDAQKRAALILEVLAGVRTVQQAAEILKISTNHYYILERKALAGLVAACQPVARRGRVPDAERQQAKLQRELTRLEQQCQRQAALVRATQRAIGVPVTSEPETARRGARSPSDLVVPSRAGVTNRREHCEPHAHYKKRLPNRSRRRYNQ